MSTMCDDLRTKLVGVSWRVPELYLAQESRRVPYLITHYHCIFVYSISRSVYWAFEIPTALDSSLDRGDNTLVNTVVVDSGDLTALQLHYTKQHKEFKSPQQGRKLGRSWSIELNRINSSHDLLLIWFKLPCGLQEEKLLFIWCIMIIWTSLLCWSWNALWLELIWYAQGLIIRIMNDRSMSKEISVGTQRTI